MGCAGKVINGETTERERRFLELLTTQDWVNWTRGTCDHRYSRCRLFEIDNKAFEPTGYYVRVATPSGEGDAPCGARHYQTILYHKNTEGRLVVQTNESDRPVVDYFSDFGSLYGHMLGQLRVDRHPNACVALISKTLQPLSSSITRFFVEGRHDLEACQEIIEGERFVKRFLTEPYSAFVMQDPKSDKSEFKKMAFRAGLIRLPSGRIVDVSTKDKPVRPGDPLRRFYLDPLRSSLPDECECVTARIVRVVTGYGALRRAFERDTYRPPWHPYRYSGRHGEFFLRNSGPR